jgi:hypothetical protein
MAALIGSYRMVVTGIDKVNQFPKRGPMPPYPPPIEGRCPLDQNLAVFIY